jgi:hypothetical protein
MCVCARLSIVPQSWCPLTPLPFAYQESKARLDRLRRRGSNQAGFEKPGELPVPGILTARYILLSACLLGNINQLRNITCACMRTYYAGEYVFGM